MYYEGSPENDWKPPLPQPSWEFAAAECGVAKMLDYEFFYDAKSM